MKYLILPLVLFIAGCTSSGDAAYEAIVELQKETQTNLTSCKNELAAVRDSNYGGFNQPEPEPEKPAEPQYEEVTVYVLADQRTSCIDREYSECGVTFSNCDNDYVYGCMTDVKYKVTEERRRVEE